MVHEYVLRNGRRIKKTNTMKRIEHLYQQPIDELLHQKYTLEKMSIDKIAKELFVSKGIVHRWLNQFDIKTRSITL